MEFFDQRSGPYLTDLASQIGRLTPFSRATRAIDAPGTSVASTIRRFSSAVRCTRFVWPPPPAPTSIESLTKRSSATQTPMSIRPEPDAYNSSAKTTAESCSSIGMISGIQLIPNSLMLTSRNLMDMSETNG
jgi:hypothetical protein